MLHLINEGNKELKNRKFPLPDGIRKILSKTYNNYDGDKTVDGYKRLKNILDMDGIKYNEMKRIKNFFDHYNGTPNSSQFILNGGDYMKNWVNNTLNTATKEIHDFKQGKKDAGISNSFIKPHEKERQIKSKKTTFSKFKTDNIGKRIMNNNDIKYESKTIYITDEQYNLLKEAKDEEFNINELESLRTFKDRLSYCQKHLGRHIGKGSSRIVFQIDDEKVLKLAFNNKGIAQNRNENDYYLINLGIVPKIFYSNNDDTFIISEYALPAKKKDFEKVENISFDDFCNFIESESNRRFTRYNNSFFNRYMNDDEIDNLIENCELCYDFSDYIGNYNPPVEDLTRIANYGLVSRNGEAKIVLLDSGLSQEIFKEYYSK